MSNQFSGSNSGFEQGFRHGFGTRSLLNSDPALPVLAPSFTVPNKSSWNESHTFTEEIRDFAVPAIGVPFREDIFQPRRLAASPQQPLQRPQRTQSIISNPSQNYIYNSNCSSNTMTSGPVIGGYNSSLELQETARLALGRYEYVKPMQMLTPDISPKNIDFRTQNHQYNLSQRKLQEQEWTLERIQHQHYGTMHSYYPSPSEIGGFSDSSSMNSLSEPINHDDSNSTSDSSRTILITPSNTTDSPIPYSTTSAKSLDTSFDSAFNFASVSSFAQQPDILAFSSLLRDLCTDSTRRRYQSERLRTESEVSDFHRGSASSRVGHGQSRSRSHRFGPYSRRPRSDLHDAVGDGDGDGDRDWQLLDYVSATVDLLWRRSLLRRWRNLGAGEADCEGDMDAATMSTGEATERYETVQEMQRLWAAGMEVQGLWEGALRGEVVGKEEMETVVVLAGRICGWVGE